MVRHAVSWPDYRSVSAAVARRPSVRLPYGRGTLEITPLNAAHELPTAALAQLVISADTRAASGSGSKQWEQNFHVVFDQLMKVVRRYPGLGKDIDAVLGEMDKTELWN